MTKNNVVLFFVIIFSSFYGCKLNNPFYPPKLPGQEAPILIYPVGDTVIAPGKVTFKWITILKQGKIHLQVSKYADFQILIIDKIEQNNSSFYIPSFVFSDTTGEYYWRLAIETRDFHQWSGWSATGSFLIKPWTNAPPITPCNPFPKNKEVNVFTDVVLTWDSGDPNSLDTIAYTVYFGKDSLFALPDTVIRDSSGLPYVTILYKLRNPLELNTTYYWKVIATDNWGAQAEGALWRFSTEQFASNPPVKPSPPQGVPPYYVDENSIFNASTTDPDGDSVLYLFDFGDGSPGHWTSVAPSGQAVIGTHIYNIPFNCFDSFFVKVKAKDVGGRESPWSDSIKINTSIRAGAVFVGALKDFSTGMKPDLRGPLFHISSCGTFLDSVGLQQLPPLGPMTLAVDQRASSFSGGGNCWVASTYDNRVFRLTNHLDNLWEILYSNPESNPSTPCIDKDGNCWCAFAWRKQVVKLDPNGNILKTINILISGTYHVVAAITLDEQNDCIWATTYDYFDSPPPPGRIFKLSTSGNILWASPDTEDFGGTDIEINKSTGDCWSVIMRKNEVVRISANCDTLERFYNFNQPTNLSLDELRNRCWISSYTYVTMLDFNGTRQDITLNNPAGIQVDTRDGSCWVSEANEHRIIKFNVTGNILFTHSTNEWGPSGITIDYYERD